MSNSIRILVENICIGLFVILIGICTLGCGSDASTGSDDNDNQQGVLGETWTVRVPANVYVGMDDMCWAGSKFVIVSTDPNRSPVISSDGVTWQYASDRFAAQKVVHYNGHILAGEVGHLMHSVDGISWDTVYIYQGVDTFFASAYTYGLFTDNEGFVTWVEKTGQGSHVAKSADGVNWTVTVEPNVLTRRAVAGTSGHTVEVGSDGILRHNGAIIQGISGAKDVIHTGSQFVVVGDNGSVISSDGTAWSLYSGPAMKRVVFTGNLYVGLGDTKVYTSLNAMGWAEKYTENAEWHLVSDMAYGNNRVVISLDRQIGDRDDALLTSP